MRLLLYTLLACCLHTAAQPIRMMTYNIRYDNPDDGEDGWSARREQLVLMTRKTEADIIGCQEVLMGQIVDLEKGLKGYQRLGVGRDDGLEEGEFSPLFIRLKRFKVIAEGHFWLSENPEQPGKGWDAACNRICTWALLKDNNTKRDLLVLNTHLDHAGNLARLNSVKQLLVFIESRVNEFTEQLQEGSESSLSVVLMGDFNFSPSDPNYQTLSSSGTAGREGLTDAFATTPVPPVGPAGTFNGFKTDAIPEERIDYIWTTGLNIRSCRHIESKLANGRWPSDHLPVVVEADYAE